MYFVFGGRVLHPHGAGDHSRRAGQPEKQKGGVMEKLVTNFAGIRIATIPINGVYETTIVGRWGELLKSLIALDAVGASKNHNIAIQIVKKS